MDATDRALIDALQDGVPVTARPFGGVAGLLGIDEDELLERLRALVDSGVLSRFGPLYDAEALGGAVTLCAMKVPERDFERIAEQVNGFAEVAHNYQRDHALNMWFVIAAETPERRRQVIAEIEACTGLPVLDLPREEAFYLGLRLAP